MFGMADKRKARERAPECATREDFQVIFTEQMASLHTLAYLLTANHAEAAACLVAGLEDSLEGNTVFRQWARTWARRAIIRNAVRMVKPKPTPGAAESFSAAPSAPSVGVARDDREAMIETVIKLPAFERFVFVVSVLEGHSVSDTAILLGCTNTQLRTARMSALERFAGFSCDPDSPALKTAAAGWFARMETA
ncbi:MAG TPA: sigma-70 family RNA polymerase sigma factor [Candidatus Angelobacter sp.]|nr:sigma-70 family RNA polymerase sigma factor [Candidatus Angelobacter sp.]